MCRRGGGHHALDSFSFTRDIPSGKASKLCAMISTLFGVRKDMISLVIIWHKAFARFSLRNLTKREKKSGERPLRRISIGAVISFHSVGQRETVVRLGMVSR